MSAIKWQLEAILSGVSHLADGGVSLRFNNIKELNDTEKIALIHSHQKSGWLAFKEDEIQIEDVPKGDTDGGKTPSQRLRATLFCLWQQTGKLGEFEDFYRGKMEKIIDFVKEKLDKGEKT